VRVLTRRRPRRAETPVGSRGSGVADETLLAAAVRSLRAGDRASRTDRAGAVRGPAAAGALRQATSETLAALRSAAAAGQTVWIGYVDDHGGTTERVVDPLKVTGSWLTAFDHGRGEVATFAAHRITGVAASA
jgi:predicted DNA-binding transcriptional regulator YafY